MKSSRYIVLITIILFVLVFLFNLPSFLKSNEDNSSTESQSETSETTSSTSASESENSDSNIVRTSSGGSDNLPVDNEWALFLINQTHPIPVDYEVKPANIYGKYQLDEKCIEYFKNMIADSRKDGVNISVASALRTNDYQQSLLNQEIQTFKVQGLSDADAYVKATENVAIPGQSEHNAGLAVDLIDDGNDTLSVDFENTDEFKWLNENAQKYGFILRYPKDKTEVTGINYEPWHYRFVGVYHATKIKESGLCLEEYIDQFGDT